MNKNVAMVLLLSFPVIVLAAMFNANRKAAGRSWPGEVRAARTAFSQALRDMRAEWIAIMGLAVILGVANYFVEANRFTLPPVSVPDWPALVVWEYWVLLRAAVLLTLLVAIPYIGVLTLVCMAGWLPPDHERAFSHQDPEPTEQEGTT